MEGFPVSIEQIFGEELQKIRKEKVWRQKEAQLIHERNMLLETVVFIREMARRVPDERAIFIEACDDVLAALSESRRQKKRRKI